MADQDDKQVPEGYFTADQLEAARREAIEQARREERDKLYPKISKQDDKFKELESELETLRKAETARQKEAERIQKEAEKAKQAKLDAEKSAKELLEQRQAEWQKQ